MNNNDLKFASTLYVVPTQVPVGTQGINLEWQLEKGDGSMIEQVVPGCFDKETEVLTDAGWKKWPDVTGDELFLSVNPETGNSSYVKAIALVSYEVDGTLEHFKGKSFDLMTTADHKHFVKNGSRGNAVSKLRTSAEFVDSTVFVNTAFGKWAGTSPHAKAIGSYVIPFSDYCILMGWYLSEGSCFDKVERENLSVLSIRQEKGRHIPEVKDIVEKVFKKKTHGTGRSELYIPREAGKFFQQFGHSGVRHIPEDIKNAAASDIVLFLEAYLKGDGYSRIEGKRTERTFFTSSKRMADDLMELIIKVGDRPSLTIRPPRTQMHRNGTYTQNGDQYAVNWLNSKVSTLKACTKELVPYNGLVYDVTLEMNNTLYVRRNGKVTISGNCGCTADVDILPDRIVAKYNDNTKKDEVLALPGKVMTVSKNLRVFLKDGKPLKVKNERGVETYNQQKATTTLFFHVNVSA